MSTALQPQITKAGLAAIWNATSTGLSAEISHIGLGSAGYTPSADQKILRTQVVKYPISGGEKLSSTLIHLTAVADDAAAFWVREVGFFLSDGTLLAVWSHPTEALTYKSANTELLLAYDLSLEALPANSVTINSTSAGLNLTLAEPIAAQATAMIAEQLRNLQQGDRLTAQERLQVVAGNRIADLLQRMSAAEQAQTDARDGLLSAAVANAIAIISLQTTVTKHIHGA
ncbi:TPA: phage tail protein [Pseudomonas putida]|uniref:phage tail-collar fiber domain-containing protein n=1 Tax=Pseudomonas putida TaxID=303 RepID=UPI0023640475|nr:phage tail protein [Pseudomonas putida]MDD2009157.1 phage tail protein [Pseudomonas putida]HDS1775885.1 phage tail protein [Pseudomonas putida]